MRTSQYCLLTLKETPADAQTASHRFMLRAGMIKKLAAGIYSWLPLGYKVLQKITNIVRDEMNRIGGLELLMPALQPAELWQESGRWENFIPPLLKMQDRNQRDFCYGPTHEEVITDLFRHELKSYKQLPLLVYQIQHKFRDELRPRSGVLRAREFLMKDAYSFNCNLTSLAETYDKIHQSYVNIFTRLGLNFRSVLADTGSIGGIASREFQILADSGEDTIAISDNSDYAANTEMAESLAPQTPRPEPNKSLEKIPTPGIYNIEDLSSLCGCAASRCLKTLIVKGASGNWLALVLRGDHQLNPLKTEKLPSVAAPLTYASEEQINAALSCKPGSIGPIGLKIPMIVDRDAAQCADFFCGSNQDGFHFRGGNWERDCSIGEIADIRTVVEGDLSPDGKGKLQLVRSIEAGHIFQLGDKYSKAMNLTFLDRNGQSQHVQMGCYGLGISRLVAAAIEQNHDEHGIIWPESMAPFTIALVPVGYHKSAKVKEKTDELYQTLLDANIEVLLEDRNDRPGVLFADMDLIGIPHRIVISEKTLENSEVEYKHRRSGEAVSLQLEEILNFLQKTLVFSQKK